MVQVHHVVIVVDIKQLASCTLALPQSVTLNSRGILNVGFSNIFTACMNMLNTPSIYDTSVSLGWNKMVVNASTPKYMMVKVYRRSQPLK